MLSAGSRNKLNKDNSPNPGRTPRYDTDNEKSKSKHKAHHSQRSPTKVAPKLSRLNSFDDSKNLQNQMCPVKGCDSQGQVLSLSSLARVPNTDYEGIEIHTVTIPIGVAPSRTGSSAI